MEQRPTRGARLELAHVEIIRADPERWSVTATYASETNTVSAETFAGDYAAAVKVAAETPATVELSLAP